MRGMSRYSVMLLVLALLVGAGTVLGADTFVPPGGAAVDDDLPAATGARAPTQDAFQKLARLASRLSIYNSHDDAATATYTCCRPDQKDQIAKAERANTIFLERFPQSDFADDTLFHMAQLAQLQENVPDQVMYYERLARDYPGSDLADDALWRLSQLYGQDAASRELACGVLQHLVDAYPLSTHASQAIAGLLQMAISDRDSDRADAMARQLFERFPRTCRTPGSLLALADTARDNGAPDQAEFYYNLIANNYPYSDSFDDALWGKAQMAVTQGAEKPARKALDDFLNACPASPFFRQAAQDYNRVLRGNAINVSGRLAMDAAEEVWQEAEHARNYREFDRAIGLYREFLANFPGNDHYDDALLNIGLSLKEMNVLCNTINNANGPEDLNRVREAWARASGGGAMPRPGTADTSGGAADALMECAFGAPGTGLAAEALHELAEVFEDMKMPELRAEVFQKLVIYYPECNPDYGTEALGELLEWYAKEAVWPDAVPLYLELADAYPSIFPARLAQNPDLLLSVLKAYEREASHAWYERHLGHIPHRTFGPGDLVDDSYYVLGGLLVSAGEVKAGIPLLREVASMSTSDFAAPALYDLARAHEKLGQFREAGAVYQELADRYPGTGLADDADDCYRMLDGTKDFAPAEEALAKAEAAAGQPLTGYDFYVGDHVIVYSPFLSAAKLRMYNMPNIWDQAAETLGKWTGGAGTTGGRQIIVLTEEPGSTVGDVIRLSAQDIGDPPNWQLGLAELTTKALSGEDCAVLRGMGDPFWVAMVQLGTANLQYGLVSETRDTIGSAAAVKLPFQQLIDLTKAARDALEAYVKDGATGAEAVSPAVAQGMLLALLDQYGYGQNGVIDCSPFETFFEVLAEQRAKVDVADRKACTEAVVAALGEAFNDDVKPAFETWGLRG